MGIWIFIVIAVLAACAGGGIYLTAAVGRWGGIRSLSGGKTWLRRLISLGVIAVVFVAMTLILDIVNAVIIFLHVIAFFLLAGLVIRLVRFIRGESMSGKKEAEGNIAAKAKTPGKVKTIVNAAGEVKTVAAASGKKDGGSRGIYWQGWIALIFSILYMSGAYYLCLTVWQTDYTLQTDKPVGTVKVAVFSDSHVGATFNGDGFGVHMETIMQQNPDIVLIPGDYVDDETSREDMEKACAALGRMHPKYGVWFSYGNHDKGYYRGEGSEFTAEDLANEMKKNGVHILEDEYEVLDNLCIVGRKDKATQKDRKDLSEILQDVDDSKYIIVMDHEPNDYEKESQTKADLVVSGHTHGGQFFPLTYFGQWFGINDRVYGYEERNDTEFIVTSGIADWELVFKTGTKSEYVIVNIQGK